MGLGHTDPSYRQVFSAREEVFWKQPWELEVLGTDRPPPCTQALGTALRPG